MPKQAVLLHPLIGQFVSTALPSPPVLDLALQPGHPAEDDLNILRLRSPNISVACVEGWAVLKTWLLEDTVNGRGHLKEGVQEATVHFLLPMSAPGVPLPLTL